MPGGKVTSLLLAWRAGDKAADALFRLLYQELKALARRQLGSRPSDATLSPTTVVHEAYLKLVGSSRVAARDRAHFFCLAARAMRQIVVDHARRRLAAKRGAGAWHTDLEAVEVPVAEQAEALVALDEALGALDDVDPRLARVVELRYFAGLSVEEAAEAMDSSRRTVIRDWQKAKAFLYRMLESTA